MCCDSLDTLDKILEAKSTASVIAIVDEEIKSPDAAKKDIKHLITIFRSDAEAIMPAVANMKDLMDTSYRYRTNLIIIIVALDVSISSASMSFHITTN